MPLLRIQLPTLFLIPVLLVLSARCSAQHITPANARLVGGPCEGCEAVYEYPRQPQPVDTLPDFREPGPRLKISGTVYKADGTTPAPNVILYVYHTNQEGIYPARDGATGWARRHGYIRGWLQTDARGRYTFYTLKPGSYPSRSAPAHIHLTLGEPDGKYYWLGSYLFDDDPLLTSEHRQEVNSSPRGGYSGILQLRQQGELLVGTRDIILGRNVPHYE